MKKKIIISSLALMILIVIGIFLWLNRTVSVITLDINPSIQVNLNRHNKVKSVVALNEDAKSVISRDLKGKDYVEAIEQITDNVIEKGYIEDGRVVVLIYASGNVDVGSVEHEIRNNFEGRNIVTDVITVENITKEDKKLAEKYDISLAKASYINSIIDNNVAALDLFDKSINELKETKMTGKYCPNGYNLEGDFCAKEISQTASSKGMVCPDGYYDYNGVCYEETGSIETNNLICNDDFKMVNGKCIRTQVREAEADYYCEIGELTAPQDIKLHDWTGGYACVDSSNAKAPTLRCLLQPHKMMNGKCYVGPAPTINGGCPGNDVLSGGGCYSLDPEDQWQCPDGGIYEKSKGTYVEVCPDTLKYTKPLVKNYRCDEGFTLEGTKCTMNETEDPYYERVCPSGYKMTNTGRCINNGKTASKVNGLVCPSDEMRLKNNVCIMYDVIEASHK